MTSSFNARRRTVTASLILTGLLPKIGFSQSSTNIIQQENLKLGTSEWKLSNPSTAGEIEGYASLTSVNQGGTINLFVNTTDSSYSIDIYRIGWYGGTGGRQMGSTIVRNGILQPKPTPQSVTGLIECNWLDPYVLSIQPDWTSGVYLAKLTGAVSGKQSYIIFTVRNDTSGSNYLFVSAVNTWQAYNAWGGKSLYAFNSTNSSSAQKVSFNRPYDRNNGSGDFVGTTEGTYGGWEINMLRFLEKEGADVAYITNIDLHEQGLKILSNRKGILFQGHDEYWSYEMRKAVQDARNIGVSLGFFGANAMYWQIRYDGGNNRNIVCYKEAAQNSDPYWLDGLPENDKYITARWRDLYLSPYNVVDPVAQPENAVIGVMYHGDPFDGSIVVSAAQHWVYSGTNVSSGYAFSHLLGYETDAIFNNGFSPAGLEEVSHSKDKWGYSSMTAYTAPSGATIFAAGSVWWAYALDDFNVPEQRTSRLDPNAQQVMRNILARFLSSSSTPATAPSAPTSLVASSGPGAITLNWVGSATAINYNVYRGTGSGNEDLNPYAKNVTSTSYIDKLATPGTTYFYQVSGLNNVGEGARSNEASAAATAPPLLSPPTNVVASQIGGSLAVKVSWNQPNNPNIVSNKIYRSVNGQAFLLLATVNPTVSYNDKSILRKTMYAYKVSTVGADNLESPSSDPAATVTTK